MSELSSPPSLIDLPSEVVLDHLLPSLELKDLTALSKVNRQYHQLSRDETFWRQKTLRDYSFSPTSLALHPSSPIGWSKRVYLGLQSPRVYVWGPMSNGRLGGASDPRLGPGVVRNGRYIDCPAEISERFVRRFEGDGGDVKGSGNGDSLASGGLDGKGVEGRGRKGMVDLQAGGWSFTSRDSDGGVWVWGQLDGMGLPAYNLENKYCQCSEPTRLPLPCRAEAISAGRRHLLVLDSDNLIWELTAWGRAYHHTAPALTSPSYSGASTTKTTNHIIQLSTGWSHSACLTSEGRIHVWFPFSQDYLSSRTPDASLNGPLGATRDSEGDEDLSNSLKWGTISGEPILTLEPPPSRPSWDGTEGSEIVIEGKMAINRQALEEEWKTWSEGFDAKQLEAMEKVVKIASGIDFLLGLRENGEVWFTRVKEGESLDQWEYLPYFSSPSISHITAQFESFTSYSTPATPSSTSTSSPAHPQSNLYHTRLPSSTLPTFGQTLFPDNLPMLQNKGIVQIALGDYHYVALTSGGEIWTWGQGGNGQLGQGWGRSEREGRENCEIPTKVVFPPSTLSAGSDHGPSGHEEEVEGGKEKFVFAIAAAGHHTGVLVLGDNQNRSNQAQQSTTSNPTSTARAKPGTEGPGGTRESGENDAERRMPGVYPLTGFGSGAGRGVFRVGYAGRGMIRGGAWAGGRGLGGGFLGPGPREFEDPGM